MLVDLLICSPTLIVAELCFLTGKTLSYAIPVVERLNSLTPRVRRADGPYCIVVVPTREVNAINMIKRQCFNCVLQQISTLFL